MHENTSPRSAPAARSLAEHTVLVTGAASGLGLAIADDLRGLGATVLAVDTAFPPAAIRGGSQELFCDITSADSWDRLAADILRVLGPITALVNNAGVGHRSAVLATPDEDWDRVLRTNLWAPWRGVKTFAEQLTSTAGCVVNVGSVYGETLPPTPTAAPTSAAYQVSKSALHRLTKILASELAPARVRVNAVLPGVFFTPLLAGLSETDAAGRVAGAPMGRPGDVAELARVVRFLLSDDASFVTGSLIPVDGGYLAAA